ncbi:MAG: hypothetical protein K6F37_03635, partial [Lachnospiraceae bacterium]|nr:hypothetical protein [Lachnospiraceae bacterium]
MSKVTINREGNKLIIENHRIVKRMRDREEVDLTTLLLNKRISSYVANYDRPFSNRVLYWEDLEEITTVEGIQKNVVLIVTENEGMMRYGLFERENAYKQFIKHTYRVLNIGFRFGKLHATIMSYMVNTLSDEKVDNIRFYIDENNQCPVKIKVYPKPMPKLKAVLGGHIARVSLPLDGLLNDETQLTNNLNIVADVNGVPIEFRVGKKQLGYDTNKYFAPYDSCYYKGYAIHLRRTDRGNFVIVKRPIEEVEKTARFRFFESKPVSFLLYNFGKFIKDKSSKKVSLFYEKFSSKAEEGTFELFKTVRDKKKGECYFIIDENSP